MGYNSAPFSLVTVARLEFLDADKGQYIPVMESGLTKNNYCFVIVMFAFGSIA